MIEMLIIIVVVCACLIVISGTSAILNKLSDWGDKDGNSIGENK